MAEISCAKNRCDEGWHLLSITELERSKGFQSGTKHGTRKKSRERLFYLFQGLQWHELNLYRSRPALTIGEILHEAPCMLILDSGFCLILKLVKTLDQGKGHFQNVCIEQYIFLRFCAVFVK